MENEAQMAQLTIKFLERSNLQGGEVPAFNAACEWLRAKIQPVAVDSAKIVRDKKKAK